MDEWIAEVDQFMAKLIVHDCYDSAPTYSRTYTEKRKGDDIDLAVKNGWVEIVDRNRRETTVHLLEKGRELVLREKRNG